MFTRLNLDIWYEIVNYFEYPRGKDILSSLAITSRCLSDLALDVVWRNGKGVSSIVSVINSFAPSPDDPFIFYSEDRSDDDGGADSHDSSSSSKVTVGSWVLNGSLPPAVCQHAFGYLARIKNLQVVHRKPIHGGEAAMVWPILASLSSHGQILPNLRRLEVQFFVFGRNEYILPLLSPSLKTLSFHCRYPPKHEVLSTFLNIAKIRGCNLEDLTYSETLTHKGFEIIMSFKTLQNVSLSLNYTHQPKVSITIAQFLASLPSLHSLSCYTGVFAPSTADEDQLCHTSLQKLDIKSNQKSLHDLFRVCIFPSVTDVKIMFKEILSMEGIKSSCPNTRKLHLSGEAFTLTAEQPLGFKHIASLLSLPIQSFSLLIRTHTLTPSDLSSFAESWPNIRFLKILSNTPFDPLPSLGVFVNHQCLECLDLYLPLQRLFDLVPKIRNLIETDAAPRGSNRHTLSNLTFVRDSAISSVSEEDKRILVGFLLRLFPNLKDLTFPFEYSSSHIQRPDLQQILVNIKQTWKEVAGSA